MNKIALACLVVLSVTVFSFTYKTFTVAHPSSVSVYAAPRIGQPAPDINLPGVDGKPMQLSSLKGKIVVIDFWASWCGPCRQENPFNVEMYDAYKDKGFTFFSVSLDRNKEAWKKAIKKDELTWNYHVLDAQGETAGRYGVEAIPATFVVDRTGKISAIGLRGAELDTYLKKMLKK